VLTGRAVDRRCRRRALTLCATLAAAAGALALAPAADAGDWMQVSCENANQSAASSEGWSSFTTGSPGYGSNSGSNCGPGTPMYAILSTDAAAPVDSSEDLQYTPPAGSTLVGGSVDVSLSADGTGYNASGHRGDLHAGVRLQRQQRGDPVRGRPVAVLERDERLHRRRRAAGEPRRRPLHRRELRR
jgi:hypothetical protein